MNEQRTTSFRVNRSSRSSEITETTSCNAAASEIITRTHSRYFRLPAHLSPDFTVDVISSSCHRSRIVVNLVVKATVLSFLNLNLPTFVHPPKHRTTCPKILPHKTSSRFGCPSKSVSSGLGGNLSIRHPPMVSSRSGHKLLLRIDWIDAFW